MMIGIAPQALNGSGGIPLKGREAEYATELWLEGPSAFWLHPEGPLSETTPDEWQAKQPKSPEIDPVELAIAAAAQARGMYPYTQLAAYQNSQLQAQALSQLGSYQSQLVHQLLGGFRLY